MISRYIEKYPFLEFIFYPLKTITIMRKKVLFGCIILSLAFAMTSCDGLNLNSIFNPEEELVGNASIVITRNNDGVIEHDSIHFTSSLVDVFDFADVDSTLGEGYSTIDISANVNLSEANVSLAFPFMYVRLDDSTAKSYTMDTILTIDLLNGLDFAKLVNVLANPDGGNMVLIAENDSCWYISHAGEFVVTRYPTVGNIVEGTFNNVEAWYVTQAKINELNDDIQNYNFAHLGDLNYYFPRVTINGNINSRRWSIIHSIFNTAFSQGGITSK